MTFGTTLVQNIKYTYHTNNNLAPEISLFTTFYFRDVCIPAEFLWKYFDTYTRPSVSARKLNKFQRHRQEIKYRTIIQKLSSLFSIGLDRSVSVAILLEDPPAPPACLKVRKRPTLLENTTKIIQRAKIWILCSILFTCPSNTSTMEHSTNCASVAQRLLELGNKVPQ